MSFLTDMNKFERNLTKEVKRVHGAIGVKYLGDIIDATPIDVESTDLFGRPRTQGRLKRSWFTSIGANPAPVGEQADPFNQMAQVVFGSMPDVTITLSNGAPYAELIEYGVEGAPNTQPPPTWVKNYAGGINFQRPNGWVRMEADKWQSAVEEAVSGVSV